MSPDLTFATPEDVLSGRGHTRLVDAVDTLLTQGVVIQGELWLTVADVELVYLGLDLMIASPDTIKGSAK